MTTGDEQRRRGRKRQLTQEERALWRTVTRSVRPLRTAAGDEAAEEPPASAEALGPAAPSAGIPRRAPRAPPAAPPPLAPLGRRLKQRVARGSEPLQARIDLHGLTQERAHHALLGFLRAAQAEHAKLVLVITGKGARGNDDPDRQRGVLKRLVPHWLELPEFRRYVLGFEPAHVGHGGEGALYVRVRRPRSPTQ